MKFVMRAPNLKESISVRTTGKAKRVIKKAIVPGYSKKEYGLAAQPQKGHLQQGVPQDHVRAQRPVQVNGSRAELPITV